jgi:hypothetical protein
MKKKPQFTSRAVLFIVKLFEGKQLDVIDVYSACLRIASSCGCFDNRESKVSLRSIVTYVAVQGIPGITIEDIKKIGHSFSIKKDNEEHEVEDMHTLLASM